MKMDTKLELSCSMLWDFGCASYNVLVQYNTPMHRTEVFPCSAEAEIIGGKLFHIDGAPQSIQVIVDYMALRYKVGFRHHKPSETVKSHVIREELQKKQCAAWNKISTMYAAGTKDDILVSIIAREREQIEKWLKSQGV